VKLATTACLTLGLTGVASCAEIAGLKDRSLEDAGHDSGTGADATVMDSAGPDAPNVQTDATDASLAGWLGPVALAQSSPGNINPLCQGPGGYLGHADLAADSWLCTSCTCPAPGCGPPQSVFYADTACSLGGSTAAFGPGECVGDDGGSLSLAFPSVACPPSGGDLTGQTVWGTEAMACPLDQAGCDAATCSATYNDGICVYQDGDAGGCPPGYTLGRFVFYGSASTPTCTACSCGPAICTPVVYGYTVQACLETGQTLDASCADLTGFPSIDLADAGVGECVPSGGELTGPLPENPRTFCCQ
jgi:hypothetical protein